jgi:hypothetical protein
MKRFLFFLTALLLTAAVVFAQNINAGGPDGGSVGVVTAQEDPTWVLVDSFEQQGYWHSYMSPDEGYTVSRLFESVGSVDKEALPDEGDMNRPDQYVLGVRVDYLHRGNNSITIRPTRPIPIEGITKLVTVWVVGRNYNHSLKLLIQDFFGREYELEFNERLNFQGWKKLTVAIPPQAEDGVHGIVQRNYHFTSDMGIKIVGFRLDMDPADTIGSYYVYFDDLRAYTDLFAERTRDPDDMNDGW